MTEARVNENQANNKTTKNGRNQHKRIDSKKLYAAGAAGLVALLLCAFFLPQMIFGIRDIYLCRDIVHDEREDLDVTLLSAAYETSLGRRLQTFADGLQAGMNYYVSEQDLDVSEDIYETLYEKLLYQDSWMTILMDIGLIPGFFSNDFTLNIWKQYVIYNDDYTGGVNFIIWYFALTDEDGRSWEILVDAEDFAIYGVYTNRRTLILKNVEWDGDIIEYFDMFNIDLVAWWYYCCYYYQSISREELDNYYNGVNYYDAYGSQSYEETVQIQRLESAWEGGDAWSSPDTDTLICHLPFVGQNIDFSARYLRNSSSVGSDSGSDGSDFEPPDLFVGIDPICRLIPEFEDLL